MDWVVVGAQWLHVLLGTAGNFDGLYLLPPGCVDAISLIALGFNPDKIARN